MIWHKSGERFPDGHALLVLCHAVEVLLKYEIKDLLWLWVMIRWYTLYVQMHYRQYVKSCNHMALLDDIMLNLNLY